MVKVSVIIPVYNAQAYLKRCLDSVVNQTLKEIEIICVDDGSSDNSYQMLEEYQKNDSRIRLFKQQNKYAGAARNLGKKHATGEYLIFWDSDDFFELNALKLLYKKAISKKADICVCSAYNYFPQLKKSAAAGNYLMQSRIPATDVFDIKTNEDYILNFTAAVPWNKLYRRAFIEEIDLDFQEIRNGNDVYFTMNAMCMAKRITTVDKRLIHYRKNEASGLVGTLSKAPLAPCYAWMDIADNLKKHNVFPERSFVNRVCESLLYVLRNIDRYDAFIATVKCLQEEGLSRLNLKVREEEFYYNSMYKAFVDHLINDTPEDFQTFLMHETYMQMVKKNTVFQVLRGRLEKLKLFKIGMRLIKIFNKGFYNKINSI